MCSGLPVRLGARVAFGVSVPPLLELGVAEVFMVASSTGRARQFDRIGAILVNRSVAIRIALSVALLGRLDVRFYVGARAAGRLGGWTVDAPGGLLYDPD